MVDEAIDSRHRNAGPNERILLHSGQLDLAWDQGTTRIPGEVYFDWYPFPHIGFAGTTTVDGEAFESIAMDSFSVAVPEKGGQAPAFLTLIEYSGTDVEAQKIVGTFREPLLVGNPCDVDSVLFHVANLPYLRGTWIREGSSRWPGRTTTTMGEFTVEIESVSALTKRIETLNATTGFAITHVGRVTRTDGRPVAFDDVEDLTTKLHWWLSLIRCERTGPFLVAGVHQTETPWEIWSAPNIERWTGIRSWAPTIRTAQEFDSGRTLHQLDQLWADARQQQSLVHAISWLSESVTDRSTASKIVAAQTGLELMASRKLVDEVGLSENGFDKLTVADSLRLTLSYAGISAAIPVEAGNLVAASAKSVNLPALDGPGAITEIRNGAVHSKVQTRFNTMAAVEGGALATHFLELLILHMLGYTGMIDNRVTRQLEAVPWAPLSSPEPTRPAAGTDSEE